LPTNVKTVSSAGLRLEADRQSVWGHQYTSGEILTQGLFSQTYGHFEMLGKMPQANGMWPAFWLLPENGTWPPEIDVVEYIYAPWGKMPSAASGGQASNPQTTLHWIDASGNDQQTYQGAGGFPYFATYGDWDTTPALEGLSSTYDGYHLYAIDWRPGSMLWLIDNQPVFCATDSATTGQRVPNMPMFMILNDAITAGTATSPGWPGFLESNQSFPLNFDIAYVRAYQFKDIGSAPTLALDVQNVSLSNLNPTAGETVMLQATLKVGPNNLGSGAVTFSIYDFINTQQYQGVKTVLSNVNVSMPTLAANQQYQIRIPYTVPQGTLPGYYGIGVNATYSEGPGDGQSGTGSRDIYIQQAQTFAVVAPTFAIEDINLVDPSGAAVTAAKFGEAPTLSTSLSAGSQNLGATYVYLQVLNSAGKVVSQTPLTIASLQASTVYPIKGNVYVYNNSPAGQYTTQVAAEVTQGNTVNFYHQTGPTFTVAE
jgi:beta-glucanase (GH16 family)